MIATCAPSSKPIQGATRRLRRAAVLGLAVLIGLGAIVYTGANDREDVKEADYWIGEGHNRIRVGNWDGAISAFMIALDMRPDARTHLFIATAYLNKSEYDHAVEECEAALRLEPANEAAKRSLAIAVGASGPGTGRPGEPSESHP